MIGCRPLLVSLVAPLVLVPITVTAQGNVGRFSPVRVIAPGQSQQYSIDLGVGDAIRVDVRQDDGDIVVALADPSGAEQVSVDASSDDTFPETLAAIADRAGTFVVVVRPVSESTRPCRYAIRIAPAHPADDDDRARVDGERAFASGARLLDRTHAAGWPEARADFQVALAAFRRADDRAGEMKALFAIARAEYYLDDPADLASSRESERIARELGDRVVVARVLKLVGNILVYRGDFKAALTAFDEAIAISRDLGQRNAEMRTMNDAALAYNRLGDAGRSIATFEQALPLARATHDVLMESNILNNLGIAYRRLGENERALAMYRRSLANRRAAGDPRGQMIALNNIGDLENERDAPTLALAYHRQALAFARQIGDVESTARALSNIGTTELQLGDAAHALEDERASLAMRERINDISGKGFALEGIGAALQRLGRLDEAADAFEQSLAIRRRIGEEYNQAESLFDLAQVERDRANYDTALAFASSAVDLDEQLRRRIDNPDLRLTFRARGQRYYEVLIDLLQTHAPATEPSAALDVSERARARVLLESVVGSRIDRSRYDALPPAEPLTTAEIQRQVLDPGTVLLEFALGDDHSWLWAVTPATVTSIALPPRRDIDALARRTYAQLSVAAAGGDAAAALSRAILGGVANQLRTTWRGKRLVIVPSGSLASVPFAALPVPGAHEATSLAAGHEVVMAPSASVIAALRADASRRPHADGGVAVIADPVFDADDPRVPVRRAATSTGARHSPAPARLSFSQQEAAAIAALAPRGSVFTATGFQATRAAVLGGALAGRRIVHIATHGVVDNSRPDRSALILSLVDRSGAPLDGYVRQRDIYGMHLDADLVVLSACQTALGREMRGEGLIGMTRAFMYAGTPRVVASLWEVGDRATAELMTRFYEALLRRHLTAAAALREAQLEMAHDPRWSSPYYWAGFVLHGDWR